MLPSGALPETDKGLFAEAVAEKMAEFEGEIRTGQSTVEQRYRAMRMFNKAFAENVCGFGDVVGIKEK